MSYFPPYIDQTGLHIPTYNDVLEELVDAARRIFGQGLYLGTDSQDYQFIATVAEKIFDTYQAPLKLSILRAVRRMRLELLSTPL